MVTECPLTRQMDKDFYGVLQCRSVTKRNEILPFMLWMHLSEISQRKTIMYDLKKKK